VYLATSSARLIAFARESAFRSMVVNNNFISSIEATLVKICLVIIFHSAGKRGEISLSYVRAMKHIKQIEIKTIDQQSIVR
jgi:hypothetical protein